MKIAVSAVGPTLDDQVDERFGRAAYLLIVDENTLAFETVDNSANRNALQGAGLGAAEAVADHGAASAITGHLGPKAYHALQLAGINGFDGHGLTVREAVAAFREGRLAALSEGEAHAGISQNEHRRSADQEEQMPQQQTILAVPSLGEGGLDAERSAHFGHCDCFTLIEITDGEIAGVRIVPNPPHVEGGCLRPVTLLASHGVTALIAAGMGARPLAGFNDAGITVYFENQTPGIGEAVQLVLDGTVETMDARYACGGGHGH